MIRWCLLPLLVALANTNPANSCQVENSCFGTPPNCQPDTDCHIYFQFDQQGNLDVYLRDMYNENAYVAFQVHTFPAIEYLICIPHQQTRQRAVSGPGQSIQIVERNMARYVRKVTNTDFVCSFLESELPFAFNNQSKFVVSEGQYDENMSIPAGGLLTPINSDLVYMHRVAATADRDDHVLTPEENKMATDLIKKMERISIRGDSDVDLESILEKNNEDSEESELENMLDTRKKFSTENRRRQIKKESPRRRKDEDEEDEDESADDDFEMSPRKRNGRPSRYQDDDDEEEEDEDFYPKKKNSRFDDDESDEKVKGNNNNKKRGRNQKRDEDDDEDEYDQVADDDDSYDDDSNEMPYVFIYPAVMIVLAKLFVDF